MGISQKSAEKSESEAISEDVQPAEELKVEKKTDCQDDKSTDPSSSSSDDDKNIAENAKEVIQTQDIKDDVEKPKSLDNKDADKNSKSSSSSEADAVKSGNDGKDDSFVIIDAPKEENKPEDKSEKAEIVQ